ncbi:hypothetical protein EYF80_017899 [Liparis tanakae]|uniref:Uncharacterized protein n=1 Tax=Liparis tanakae TaxID=230148 RepID=A0A4Z2I3P5_9TELE|nr:hypothetical protein EYF80_017899 [Liparis tanakae]
MNARDVEFHMMASAYTRPRSAANIDPEGANTIVEACGEVPDGEDGPLADDYGPLVKDSNVYYLYLITGCGAGSESQHSPTAFLEGSSDEASHIGRDATLLRVLLL